MNCLVVATRWSTLVIKMNGRINSDEFKKIGFGFTVILLA